MINSMQSYKSKIDFYHKSSPRPQFRGGKPKKVSRPSYFELCVLLFGMFGVPVSYILYSNMYFLYHWSTGTLADIPAEAVAAKKDVEASKELNSATLETIFNENTEIKAIEGPISLSLREIITQRLENMKKYSFKFSWTEIDRRNGLSGKEFHDIYSGKWPLIITGCGKKWPAFTKWNKEFFYDNYGKDIVTVKTYQDGVRKTYFMTLEVYISHLNEGFPNKWTYIVDEVFIQSRPELERDLGTCDELKEDFFKLFPSDVRPWRYNLLLGPRYSRSELQVDPLNWTGTVMLLSGLKRWKLFPPGQDHLLHIIPNQKNKIPMTYNSYQSYVDCFNNDDLMRFSSVAQAKVIEFYQYPGELLIIPTGWFHQVFNEEITLAVSGQLMNKDNYKYILEELYKGGEIPRDVNSANSYNNNPKKEIIKAISKISQKSLTMGKEVTLMKLAQASGLSPPPSYSNVLKSQYSRI